MILFRIIRYCCIFTLFFFQFSPILLKSQTTKDYYNLGQTERESGYFSIALEIWLEAKNEMEKSGIVDPRIGIAFIELATENENIVLYEKATEMYLWAFSGTSLLEYIDTITEEVERIKPLLEDDEKKVWDTLLKDNDPGILSVIRKFWIKKDLTPATPLNERLTEHWERIAYARQNFKRSKRSPYGTDDRGTIYVQFGEPDRKDYGNLGDDIMELDRRFDEAGRTGIRKSLKLNSGNITINDILTLQFYPEFEVWTYYELADKDDGIYVFGKPHDDRFRLFDSIEELIPNAMFAKRNELNNHFLPGALVQLMYYHQLRFVNDFFSDRYYELENVWDSSIQSSSDPGPPRSGITKGTRQKFIVNDEYDHVKLYGPKEKTSFEYIPINISVSQVRLLDENNQPYVAVITTSSPDKIVYERLTGSVKKTVQNTTFAPVITLISRDENMQEIDRYSRSKLDTTYRVSTFLLDYEDIGDNYVLSADASMEIVNADDPGSSQKVPFLGKENFILDDPLVNTESQLVMSDLILGINTPVMIDRTQYPFPVIPVENVMSNENFAVYLEMYHLTIESDGVARYRISYQVDSRKKKGIFSRLFGGNAEPAISISADHSSRENRSEEHISFDISGLKPADYEFKVTVTDLLSGQEITRSENITIIK